MGPIMKLSPVVLELLCLGIHGCATQPTAGISLGFLRETASDASDAADLSWSQVTDGLYEHGYALADGGPSPYGSGCWVADAFVFDMRTTIFIDTKRQVFEEFPPAECRRGG